MTNAYYGYVRVSTLKQEAGVSLTEQKNAISQYAIRNGLEITEWFEEKETAARQGRPLFTLMMNRLRGGKAKGVVMHKIDRSARNLRDWSELGSLIDHGIDVRFAHESLDLTARGGRLSADIQAVIAADYIRNLREEAIKGIYGRLKQGIYPFKAPLGYLDAGGGNPKILDPVNAPMVRKAFEWYGTGRYGLRTLLEKLERLGLKNSNGTKLRLGNLSKVLNNPFYAGVMVVKGQSFSGIHEPLISQRLYRLVRDRLSGKSRKRRLKHEFLFRKLLSCASCGKTMYAEWQKSRVYYRCQTSTCTTKCVRETALNQAVRRELKYLELLPVETQFLTDMLQSMSGENRKSVEEARRSISMRLERAQTRKEQLTDAFLDGTIEKEDFQSRSRRLLLEIGELEASEMLLKTDEDRIFQQLREFLELAKNLVEAYETANFEQKRKLVEILFSNLAIEGKKLAISMHLPFSELKVAQSVSFGGLSLDTPRLHPCVIDLDQTVRPVTRKPMTEQGMRGFLEYLLSHPELLPDLSEQEDKLG